MMAQAPKISFGARPKRAHSIEKPQNMKKTLLRLAASFSSSRSMAVFLAFCAAMLTLVSLAAPALQGAVVDAILDQSWTSFARLLSGLALVFAAKSILSFLQALCSARLSRHLVRQMRNELFAKIQKLPIAYLDTHSSGDIMSRMSNDIDNISGTVSSGLGSLVSGILTMAGTIVIMFVCCWQLTLVAMSSMLLSVLITKVLSTKMHQTYRARSMVMGRLNGHAEEMITGYQSVHAFDRQADVRKEFAGISDDLMKQSIRSEILAGSMGPLMNAVSALSFVIVAAFGGYFALKGTISIGVISAFILYVKQFSRPVNDIAQLYGSFQTAVSSAECMYELTDQPEEDNSGSLEIENLQGMLSFRNVHFSYEPGKEVLHDFSLDIHPGEKVALVGATGSGKTTVVNLLMRYYNADRGEILVDGRNIMDCSRNWLRKNTAIVLQDTVLFSDTVENNIRYSSPDADHEQVCKAALSANCQFIDRLKDGYASVLNQGGNSLSSGQRQLLSIARALLADPKILILDEATSCVDTRTEQHIQDAMGQLMKNRTCLIIAHRLSTIRDADKIVVLDQGRIVESGNHDQLMRKQGKYHSLYMTQFAGCQI